jgi:UDP-N-acetylglucosamine--N-acetylmuramyl-(pentapeptide) pyrophosphoryl-undecaprenol N-acetylglucosamine transferase
MNSRKKSKQQTEETRKPRFIISGGGTGGHIFPAISIANALRQKCPEADILFVGAENRMEMEKSAGSGLSYHRTPCERF